MPPNNGTLHYVGSFETSEPLNHGRLERQTHVYCLELKEESSDFTINSDEVEKADWVSLRGYATSGLQLTKGAARSLELLGAWMQKSHKS